MRIVFGTSISYPNFDTGGVVHTFNVARQLVKFGHEVTILCAKTSLYPHKMIQSEPDNEEIEGIRIIRTKRQYKNGATLSSLPSLIEQYFQLKKMIKDNKVDIVNADTYRSCIPLIAAAKNKIPCTATIHSLLLNGKFFGLTGWTNFQSGKLSAIIGCLAENTMLRLPYDGLMVTSDWIAGPLSQYQPNKPIHTIYAGVDLDEIDSVICTFKYPHQIAFMGTLIKHKNILDVMESVKLARKEIKDLKLVIISGGGEYEEFVKNACKQDPLFEYHKSPDRKQIYKLLKESSLLVHPSEGETFGLAPAEAIACGTPIIVYDIPSMRELVQRFQGGETVPYKDCEALSHKICELLNDRVKIQELAKQGRKVIETKFTWEQTARRMEESFKNTINLFHQ